MPERLMVADESSGPPSSSGSGSTSADDLEKTLTEELAPDLQVVRRLGRGSMASVYLAREPALKRLVAIKVLAPKLARDERARLRFEREAQAVASLSHPHIVSVHRVGRLSSGLPYIVMQYVKGTTMADRLEASGKLPVDEAQRLLGEIASAAAAAHQKGIVHRDIRPANILYDEEGGSAMLTDFGIAAILATGDSEEPARLTRTGELVGNPAYMSPEQLLGEQVTERSDVYALGLLGYELLAGEGPYEAKSKRELFAAHVKDQPRPLIDVRADAGVQLSNLLARCLAKEPERRPSASDVAKRLTGLSSGEILAAPASGEETRGFFGRLADRRVPGIVAVYAAGGFGVLELVDQLVGHGMLPEVSYQLALVTYLSGIPAVVTGAWLHGERGRQMFSRIEYSIYGVVVVVWAIASFVVLLR